MIRYNLSLNDTRTTETSNKACSLKTKQCKKPSATLEKVEHSTSTAIFVGYSSVLHLFLVEQSIFKTRALFEHNDLHLRRCIFNGVAFFLMELDKLLLESLILAQDERWRRA